MSRSNPAVRASEAKTIVEKEQKIEDQIRERAHAIFESHGGGDSRALDDWLAAEHELIWKPPLEVIEKGNELAVQIAAPGLQPKHIRIEITPTDLLIEAEADHSHGSDESTVHVCEFKSGLVFRAVRLPRPIAPKTVKADYRNGMLRVTAMIAAEESEERKARSKSA